MFVNLFIIVVSTALFVYWFRYACVLILATRTKRDYTRQVADANNLTFLQSRLSLAEPEADLALDGIHAQLHRDYQVLTYLLRHATGGGAGELRIEQWMLRFDYALMRVWYRTARLFSGTMARSALLEMSTVVGHLANVMGERSSLARRH